MAPVRTWDSLVTVVLGTVIIIQMYTLWSAGFHEAVGDNDVHQTKVEARSNPMPTTATPPALRASLDLSITSPTSTQAPHQKVVRSAEWLFEPAWGVNPPHCNVVPNRTAIDPYKGCPLPGLNNLLFTQVNRWYCALRDNRVLHLRDRTCNKGSGEPFRFSTILQIDYTKLVNTLPGRSNAAICWSDISKQDVAPHCEWKDIPSMYGTELWWRARRHLDFHTIYYEMGAQIVSLLFREEPFLAVHLRRGDYWQHCVVIKKRGVPPWISFKNTKKLFEFEQGCYPSIELVEQTLLRITSERQVKRVFIATNTPDEFANMSSRMATNHDVIVQIGIPETFFSSVDGGRGVLRKIDKLIVEMVVLSMGSVFLFNRYSSLSGMAYEMAVIHDRATPTSDNVICW